MIPALQMQHTMHRQVREILLHAMIRYQLHCAAYCLMPDHAHFLWMGVSPASDQLNALRFFRKEWNHCLSPFGVSLQHQAYDHVLGECDKDPEAFADTVLYILHNPLRAKLVEDWQEWPYFGNMIPGYPRLEMNPLGVYWPKFWAIHNRERTRCAQVFPS